MANRKLLRLKPVVVWLAWGGFALTYLTLLLLPAEVPEQYLLAALALIVILIPVSVLCATALVVIYYRFFGRWRGVAMLMIMLTLGRWLTTRSLLPDSIELAVLVLTVDVMVVLGVSLTLLLWKRDVGLRLIGWVSALIIWVLLIANRLQGNLLDTLLRSLGNPTDYPFWWLDSLWCFSWWSVPLGTLSFLWHTLQLVRKEIGIICSS